MITTQALNEKLNNQGTSKTWHIDPTHQMILLDNSLSVSFEPQMNGWKITDQRQNTVLQSQGLFMTKNPNTDWDTPFIYELQDGTKIIESLKPIGDKTIAITNELFITKGEKEILVSNMETKNLSFSDISNRINNKYKNLLDLHVDFINQPRPDVQSATPGGNKTNNNPQLFVQPPKYEPLPSNYGKKKEEDINKKFRQLREEMMKRYREYQKASQRANGYTQAYYGDLIQAINGDLRELNAMDQDTPLKKKIDFYNRISYEFHLEVKYNVNLTSRGMEWSMKDLNDLNRQLGLMHNGKLTTQNPRLREIRMEAQEAGKGGFNKEGLISIGPGQVDWAIIHEVGHYFENENPKWQEFKALSGWKDVSGKFDKISSDYSGNAYQPYNGSARLKENGKIYKDGDKVDLDGDGQNDGVIQIHYGKVMVYDLDATFISDSKKTTITNYSRTNPKEDFAETFKYFFTDPEELKKVCPEKFQFMVDFVGYDPTNIVYKPINRSLSNSEGVTR